MYRRFDLLVTFSRINRFVASSFWCNKADLRTVSIGKYHKDMLGVDKRFPVLFENCNFNEFAHDKNILSYDAAKIGKTNDPASFLHGKISCDKLRLAGLFQKKSSFFQKMFADSKNKGIITSLNDEYEWDRQMETFGKYIDIMYDASKPENGFLRDLIISYFEEYSQNHINELKTIDRKPDN